MFGDRLKQLRQEHGWTMEEVGLKIGIKKSSYASYESKYRQPPLEKLKSLSKLYNVSVDYILGLSNTRNNEKCNLKEALVKRRLHWDGMDIPEDVMMLIEKLLDDAAQFKLDQQLKREC